MHIKKFKLIDGGRGGVQIQANEYLASGKMKIVDKVDRERKIPLSDDLMDDVKKLKYFLLNLTNHWIPVYTKYYDSDSRTLLPVTSDDPDKPHLIVKDLWSKTEITGAQASPDGFLLTGKMETVKGKYISLSTPKITHDDDFSFFEECLTVLNTIADGITEYVMTYKIPLEIVEQELSLEFKEGKTEEELQTAAMKRLEERGAVILMPEDHVPDIISDSEVKVIEKTGSIDGNNIESVDTEEDAAQEFANEAIKAEQEAEDKVNNSTLEESKEIESSNIEEKIVEESPIADLEYSHNVGETANTEQEEEELNW